MAASINESKIRSYLGQSLLDVPTPAAVLDLAKLETNCHRMLDAVGKWKIQLRAHVKTHKTTQLTRLQVGDGATGTVNLAASTLVEVENLIPLCLEYQSKGIKCNVLYAFPLFASSTGRLARANAQLGPGGLSVLVDHPAQLALLPELSAKGGPGRNAQHPPLVFAKIDANYHRAGVEPATPACDALLDGLLASEAAGHCVFHGLYCHAGQSYYDRFDWEAMEKLAMELSVLVAVSSHVSDRSPGHSLVLSVGATPTATTLQWPGFFDGTVLPQSASRANGPASQVEIISDMIHSTERDRQTSLEVHAGVYPTLDIQQLATHARDRSWLSANDIAISILADVVSVYTGRGPEGTTEALVNAGSLALGREPVKDMGDVPGRDYQGWGIIMPWQQVNNPAPTSEFPRVHGGWQVARISQEHGILGWVGSKDSETPLEIGQRLRIWPNHSCIAGAGFDYYLIVDSRREGKGDEIIDVWPRWRGW